MTVLTVVFYAATYGVLAVLSWREFHAWCVRRGIEQNRREAARLGRIQIDPPTAPHWTRDPSPRPRTRQAAR